MGLLEERRAQHKAREANRNWGLAISGRSPIVSPMYGDRQAGRRQGSVTIEPPNGRHVTLDVPAQTWDGPLDFGDTALQDLGWTAHEPLTGASTEAKAPATGYYDLHVDLETSEADDVALTLEVDGDTRWSKTLDVFLSLNGVLAVGEWRRGQTLRLLSDKPVTVSGGRVSMQLVEPQVGQVEEPEQQPIGGIGGQHGTSAVQSHALPVEAQAGDLLLVGMCGRSSPGDNRPTFHVADATLIETATADTGYTFARGRHSLFRLTLTSAHIAAGEFEYWAEADGDQIRNYTMSGLLVPGGTFDAYDFSGLAEGSGDNSRTVALSGAQIGFGMASDHRDESVQELEVSPARDELWRFPATEAGNGQQRTLWWVAGDEDTLPDQGDTILTAWHVRFS